MAKYDYVIVGGLVVTPTEVARYDVGIVGEQIAAVEPAGTLVKDGSDVIDAKGCYVIPGGVDPHVHYKLRVPGMDGKPLPDEDPEYSFAAAFGGTTTIIDFAIWEREKYDEDPSHSLQAAISAKKEEVAGRMAVDYGLHALFIGNPPHEVIDEIGAVVSAGIPTIKTSSACPPWTSDDGHRFGVMMEVAKHGGVHILHAEDQAIIDWLTAKYIREGKVHGAYTSETRGPLVEEAAIRRGILLAERTGCPLYIFHVGAAAGAQAIREARARNAQVYGETLSCHLSFTADDLWDDSKRGLLWNNWPSVKFHEDRSGIWEAIADDALQVVSSDHWAMNSETRYEGLGATIEFGGQSGQAAIEMRVPVLFHMGVSEGRLSLRRFVDLISTNPAKLMGLYPRKGCIQVGSDADLVLFDPAKEWTVRQSDHHMGVDYNCWEGWDLRGKVRSTFLRGTPLVLNEEWVGRKDQGQYILRKIDQRMLNRQETSSINPPVRTRP